MELLDILQAFKGGKDVEYRALKGQVWQRVCGDHKWNTEKFEYRVKPEYLGPANIQCFTPSNLNRG